MAEAQEIEIRYKVQDRSQLEAVLMEVGALLEGTSRLVDHWFIPVEVTSAQAQAEWFDSGRGCSIRVREKYEGESVVETSLGTKRVTDPLGHKALSEAEVQVESYAIARPLLAMMDRKEFLTIDKTRTTYRKDQFEITIDDIQGYGTGAEIELKEKATAEEGVEAIRTFAKTLGLTEADEHEKSITVSAMKALAHYE